MRVLLVDPHPASRSIIASWVDEFFGHVGIESVASGAEALQAIDHSRPDLVLAAHPLPALDGIALTTVIKARPHPPVIVAFLQRRFPKVWADGVVARSRASVQ